MKHPPWLRFQAYTVGLPKTGSTSLATIFAAYRTAHELRMRELLEVALPWRDGEISTEEFWQRTTPRLTRPPVEMDSATVHHVYAELLVERFPKAVFVHSVRDVGGWISSLLDMAMRYRYARAALDMPYAPQEIRYIAVIAGQSYRHDQDPRHGDAAAIVPMMRYWAEHMTHMAAVLPAHRSLVVRTKDLRTRLDDLAALCGVPAQTLRADLSHSNQAAQTLDRLSMFRSPEVEAAYEQYCADIMARMFPEEHARVFAQDRADLDWGAHCEATRDWAQKAVEQYGSVAGH